MRLLLYGLGLSALLVASCAYGQSVDLALTGISSENEILAPGDTTSLTAVISQNGPDDLPVGTARIWMSLNTSVARWITSDKIVDNFGNEWTLVTTKITENTAQIQLRNNKAVFKNGVSIELRIPIVGINEGIITLTSVSTVFGKGVSDRNGTNQSASTTLKIEKQVLENQSSVSSRNASIDVPSFALDLESDATYLYPNPVKDVLKIKGKATRKVQLANKAGEVVYNSDHISSEGIDMGSLPTGVYLVRITHKDGSLVTKKIIKP